MQINPLAAAVAAAFLVAAAPKTPLEVTGGWSRPASAGSNGAGYFTILNRGARPEVLVGVETPVAARVEMHSMSMAGGVMRMGEVKSVVVPAGGRTAFGPGGYHLMLIGLKKPLNPGDQVPATLAFASGARIAATLAVAVTPPSL
jgi:copper(I)-binding protein